MENAFDIRPETIDIRNVYIAIIMDNTFGYKWYLLERKEDRQEPNIFMRKPSYHYENVYTKEEIVVDKNMLVSTYVPINVEDYDCDTSLIKVRDIKSIREIYEQSKKFFSEYINSKNKEEIERIMEIYARLDKLFEEADKGTKVLFTPLELELMFNSLIDMYTYAYGNPTNSGLSRRLYKDNFINAEAEFDLNNLYKLFVDAVAEPLERPIELIVEKKPDITIMGIGEDNKTVQVYRNLKSNVLYYFSREGRIYTKDSQVLPETQYQITEEFGFKELFYKAKEGIYGVEKDSPTYAEIKEFCRDIEEKFQLQNNEQMIPILKIKPYLMLFESLIFMGRVERFDSQAAYITLLARATLDQYEYDIKGISKFSDIAKQASTLISVKK